MTQIVRGAGDKVGLFLNNNNNRLRVVNYGCGNASECGYAYQWCGWYASMHYPYLDHLLPTRYQCSL